MLCPLHYLVSLFPPFLSLFLFVYLAYLSFFVLAIHEEYVHPELTSAGNKKFSFDVYIPDLRLALEYHGALHYSGILYII